MRLSVTNRCNLRCRYCRRELPEGPEKRALKDEELLMIVRAAASCGIDSFKITGGEPLLRPGIAELTGQMKELPGVRSVTMTTNGVLLKGALPELIKNGLDAVTVSLDSLNRETYRRITGEDRLSGVLGALKEAAASSLKVKVNTVLQKGVNDTEWPELAALAKEMPVDVRFIELMPIGCGRDFEGVDFIKLYSALKKSYPALSEDTESHGNGPAVYYKIPGFSGSVGFISALSEKFCDSCNRLRLTSSGALKPCLCYNTEVDLMPLFTETDKEKLLSALKDAIRKAALMKPEGHSFGVATGAEERRSMADIGG